MIGLGVKMLPKFSERVHRISKSLYIRVTLFSLGFPLRQKRSPVLQKRDALCDLSKIALSQGMLFVLFGLLAAGFCGPLPAGPHWFPPQGLQTFSQRFANLQKAEDPSFRKHVIPLLARLGCSARECHGSFQGRGGFQLSLFGSEWDEDFIQLTQKKGNEDETHINPTEPEKSLIILKPTLQMKHKGKERYKKDSWQYNLILTWIRNGAKNDAEKTGELQRLEAIPSEMVFARAGQTVQLKVLAHWVDGSVEDVTELTRFKTNDEAVAAVSEAGLVSSTGKGDTHIVISYDSGVLPVPAMLAVSEFSGSKFPVLATHNKVDELVLNKLRKMGIVPSELCTDAEFLRRVSLDLTGTPPLPDDVLKFLSDTSPNKRSAKIDELLKSPAYAAWWTTKFCDYTAASSRSLNLGSVPFYYGDLTRQQWYHWIYNRIATNVPYNQIASSIVLATGRRSPDQSYKDFVTETDSYFRGDKPVDYANHPTLPFYWQRRDVMSADQKMLSFAHTFLGVRLECAQCHKHPFDRWTKNDFKQFSAIFKSIMIGNNPGPHGPEAVSMLAINNDIKTIAETEFVKKEGATVKELDAKRDKKDGKAANIFFGKANEYGQLIDIEFARRTDAGEPAPWAEVWTDPKNMRVEGQTGPNPKLNPKILGGDIVVPVQDADPRQPLMDWLLNKSNPYFAKAMVNRVWASYFNRGIVDPPDDLNIANAPSNGELLNYLAEAFVEHGYDLAWLHREILNSDTYQRSWDTNATNEADTRNFSHAAFRQIPAEVMFDAIDMAVCTNDKLATFATNFDARAIGPIVGENRFRKPGQKNGTVIGGEDQYFLNLFGKPARAVACDCERSGSATLLQTLFTRNDQNLLSRIDGKDGHSSSWIAELRADHKNPLDVDKTIAQVFLRTVSRPPTREPEAGASPRRSGGGEDPSRRNPRCSLGHDQYAGIQGESLTRGE